MNKYVWITLAALVVAMLVLLPKSKPNETDMSNSRFDADGKLYVASEFNGQLVRADGTPAAEIPVEREVRWRDDRIKHQAVTDAEGRFNFPEIIETGWWINFVAKWLPGETTMTIDVLAEINGEKKELFLLSKFSLKNHSELGEHTINEAGDFIFTPQPIDLVCNIDKEPGADNKLDVFGVCEERTPGPRTKTAEVSDVN